MVFTHGYTNGRGKVVHYPSIEFESSEELQMHVKLLSEIASRGMYDSHDVAEKEFAQKQLIGLTKAKHYAVY